MTNKTTLLFIIFLSSFALKSAFFFLATDPIIFGKYPFFAEKISWGMDIGERIVDLSPVYLYFNVIFFQIYGKSWEGLAFVQILIGSLNCLLIYVIGEKVFNKSVGLIASLLLILYGNMTILELTLEPETLVIFLNSASVLVLLKARENSLHFNRWWFLASGILIGLSAITKPNFLLFLPAAITWVWWGFTTKALRIQATGLLVLGILLAISPVTLRNYLKCDDFILITADGGKVFFHGNGPGATGMERADLSNQGFREESEGEPDAAHSLFRKTARMTAGSSLKPSECSHFWFSYAMNYIWRHPAAAMLLELKKFVYFWGDYEVHEIDSNYKNYLTLKSWPLLSFGFIAIPGILGMILARRMFRKAFLLYAVVFLYMITVLVFFAASRYRAPAVPFLAIFAGFAVSHFYRLWQKREGKDFFIGVSAGLTLYLLFNFMFHTEVQKLDRWQRATRIHYSLGGNFLFKGRHYREAIEEYRKALALAPDFTPAYNRLGMTLAILNEFDEAEKCFRKVIELAPDMDQGYLNLGMLYKVKGKPEYSLPLLEKALSLNPQNAKAKEHIQILKSQLSG